MNQKKTFILLILTSFAFTNIHSQDKKFSFFGSYNYGFGNLIASESADLYYPYKEEVNKLRTGTMKQFEAGVYYASFGLGLIHNTYETSASTAYENADINNDAYFGNGIISDELDLRFTGLELLYKTPSFIKKMDVTWKIGLGIQSYSINKEFNLMEVYPSQYEFNLTGDKWTMMGGVEINYQLWKFIGIGLETSILPGNYTNLKDPESSSYINSDNVTRLNAGLKIRITI